MPRPISDPRTLYDVLPRRARSKNVAATSEEAIDIAEYTRRVRKLQKGCVAGALVEQGSWTPRLGPLLKPPLLLAVLFLWTLPIQEGLSQTVERADSHIDFSPSPDTKISATVSKSSLSYSIDVKDKTPVAVTVPLGLESTPHVLSRDYNFDGYPDLSLWYRDEGMGVSTFHRIFLFVPSTGTLAEAHPQCGEEFVNLRIDATKKLLLSTVMRNGRPKTCKTMLSPKQAASIAQQLLDLPVTRPGGVR